MIRWLLLVALAVPSLSSASWRRRPAQQRQPNTVNPMVRNMYNMYNVYGMLREDSNENAQEELDDVTPSNHTEYDFIVVGAGTAGAAVAARLSEVPDVSVLLIEAGPRENRLMEIPMVAAYLQFSDSINWNYKTQPSETSCLAMKNHQCKWPRGKVMGGCSVFNFMAATRGNRRDYNGWAAMGCDGWSFDEVLPYFMKLENFEVTDTPVEKGYHSTGGPVNIGSAPYRTPLATAFLGGAQELGYQIVDYDGKEQIGFSYLHSTVKDGERLSSNRAYLHPVKNRTNLILSRNSRVDKVLIDPSSKRAYGVLFIKRHEVIEVRAKKEVIVCAGAVNSPKLLMLSGIGPERHLYDLGIDLVQNLPGVGENLQDHLSYWNLNFLINETASIRSMELMYPTDITVDFAGDYMKTKKGPFSVTGGIEALGFVNVDELSSTETYPNIEILFAGLSAASDPLFHMLLGLSEEHYDATYRNMLGKESFMILTTLIAPKSRGRILLQSKRPEDDPEIYANYFSNKDDVRVFQKGIELSIQLSKTRAMQKFNATLSDNPILGCEHFVKGSDAYWDCAIRSFSSTLYHPAGTCKMGPVNDVMAVVDPRLRVIGIDGLRVADASIMPMIIAGHPNIPIMLIGEKLADMVKEDWDLLSNNQVRKNRSWDRMFARNRRS
ncbi:glucose dehydrogenase [FAD, quinone]-like [Nasonia vitripennis]|uniref:Glucose-methanol-choline oxidoreductase N-terminal domain-containing protein n=1 Tax=Nasonia vitripennis TaxID=7425 RepID=A0A7M7GCB1_NASVI|nr:glucose dehydrogenase [FAD, quinone]-like [Nasonia vitripennis]